MLPTITATLEDSRVGTSNLTPSISCFLTLRSSLALQSSSTAEFKATAFDIPALKTETVAPGEQANFESSPTYSIKRSKDKGDEAAALADAESAADEAVYEEVNLQDLEFDAVEQQFVYPCPCGDLFELPLSELRSAVDATEENRGFAIASCPSCSLKVKVLFDLGQLKHMEKELCLSLSPGNA